jgi:hypothetical protein
MQTVVEEFSSWSSILIGLVTIISVVQVLFTIKRKARESETLEKTIETVRQHESVTFTGQENTNELKRSLEEEKYALFLQYHSQGLSQSQISFWFSLVFAAIGFAIIVMGILSVQKDISIWNQGKAFITLISGVIIDAVSALFFVQSNKARQLMIEFFDKLRTDRKFEESLKLANEIPDDTLKSRLKIALAMNFAEIVSNDVLLAQILQVDQIKKKEDVVE